MGAMPNKGLKYQANNYQGSKTLEYVDLLLHRESFPQEK